MVIFCVSNLCSLLIRLYSTCTNLDKSIVTRCDNTDANKFNLTHSTEDPGVQFYVSTTLVEALIRGLDVYREFLKTVEELICNKYMICVCNLPIGVRMLAACCTSFFSRASMFLTVF